MSLGDPSPDTLSLTLRVLSAADASRYRKIFDLQDEARWKDADALIAKLEDRLLLGHVQAQRFLHPKYRSTYGELAGWLAANADHPEAPRLYGLALSRKPRGAAAPEAPRARAAAVTVAATPRTNHEPPPVVLTAGERAEAKRIEQQVHAHLRRGLTKGARAALEDAKTKRLLGAEAYGRAATRLATAYFADGEDALALQWAGAAAKRAGALVPEADWTAGLAAWRLGRIEDAAQRFRAAALAASAANASPWLISAAAFWAARAHLQIERPEVYNEMLAIAAAYPRTFYGMIARRASGLPMMLRWEDESADTRPASAVADLPAGQRALALVQVGEVERGERELTYLAVGAPASLAQGILAIADAAGMPALAFRMSEAIFPGSGIDVASYPIPRWTPPGGFRVDRALVYALIRQESAFNPGATSRAGARGLMQLMPGTAGFVAGNAAYRSSKRNELLEPEVNLELGQTYIEVLLADPAVKGDLFQLAVAWNGGPGNLSRWQKNARHGDDPLLFIESIPYRETRAFIERVLANLWIYRDRLGQPTPSLDAIAAGEWPRYKALDAPANEVASRPNGN